MCHGELVTDTAISSGAHGHSNLEAAQREELVRQLRDELDENLRRARGDGQWQGKRLGHETLLCYHIRNNG
jgi:hypothetical protein